MAVWWLRRRVFLFPGNTYWSIKASWDNRSFTYSWTAEKNKKICTTIGSQKMINQCGETLIIEVSGEREYKNSSRHFCYFSISSKLLENKKLEQRLLYSNERQGKKCPNHWEYTKRILQQWEAAAVQSCTGQSTDSSEISSWLWTEDS